MPDTPAVGRWIKPRVSPESSNDIHEHLYSFIVPDLRSIIAWDCPDGGRDIEDPANVPNKY